MVKVTGNLKQMIVNPSPIVMMRELQDQADPSSLLRNLKVHQNHWLRGKADLKCVIKYRGHLNLGLKMVRQRFYQILVVQRNKMLRETKHLMTETDTLKLTESD